MGEGREQDGVSITNRTQSDKNGPDRKRQRESRIQPHAFGTGYPGLPGLEPALGIIGEAILLEPGEVLSADSIELWVRHFAQLLRQRRQYRYDQSMRGGRPRSARVIEIGATKGM